MQESKPDAITPKDTAQQLVDDHASAILLQHGIYNKDEENAFPLPLKFAYQAARQAALKSVNEILSVLDTFQTHAYAKVLIPHYRLVKEEIQNL